MGIPIVLIRDVLDETFLHFIVVDDEKWVVVDGLQRLTTFQKFLVDNEEIMGKVYISREVNEYESFIGVME